MTRAGSDQLTSAETAEFLRVSAASVKRWSDQGWLPSVRTRGGHRRFRRTDVEEAALRLSRTSGAAVLVERLAARESTLNVQGELLAERARLGSWAALRDSCLDKLRALTERYQSTNAPPLSLAISQRVLEGAIARCADECPVRPGTPSAVVAAVEGEQLTVDLALIHLCLREAGWRVWNVGTAPACEIARFVSARGVHAIVVYAGPTHASAILEGIAGQVVTACQEAGLALAFMGGGAWPGSPPARVFNSTGPLCDWLVSVEQGGAVVGKALAGATAWLAPELSCAESSDANAQAAPGEAAMGELHQQSELDVP